MYGCGRWRKVKWEESQAVGTPPAAPHLSGTGVGKKVAKMRAPGGAVALFLPAVIDRVVEIPPVAGASAVFGSDDHVTFAHERPNVRDVNVTQVAVNSVVNEDQRRVRSQCVLRRKEIRGDRQLVFPTVRDLSHDHLGAELRHEREISQSLEELLKLED